MGKKKVAEPVTPEPTSTQDVSHALWCLWPGTLIGRTGTDRFVAEAADGSQFLVVVYPL